MPRQWILATGAMLVLVGTLSAQTTRTGTIQKIDFEKKVLVIRFDRMPTQVNTRGRPAAPQSFDYVLRVTPDVRLLNKDAQSFSLTKEQAKKSGLVEKGRVEVKVQRKDEKRTIQVKVVNTSR